VSLDEHAWRKGSEGKAKDVDKIKANYTIYKEFQPCTQYLPLARAKKVMQLMDMWLLDSNYSITRLSTTVECATGSKY